MTDKQFGMMEFPRGFLKSSFLMKRSGSQESVRPDVALAEFNSGPTSIPRRILSALAIAEDSNKLVRPLDEYACYAIEKSRPLWSLQYPDSGIVVPPNLPSRTGWPE